MAGTARHRAAGGGGGTPATSLAIPTSSSLASTPNHADFATADVDVRVRMSSTVWPPTATGTCGSQCGPTGNRRWTLFLQNNGRPSLGLSVNGTSIVFKAGSAAVSTTAGTMFSLRAVIDADNGASGYSVLYYTRGDADLATNTGWTQLGTTVTTAGAITLPDTTAPLEVGHDENGDGILPGNYERLVLMSGIGGSVVADFNATLVTRTGTQAPATYTDTTGKVWTVTGPDWSWNT